MHTLDNSVVTNSQSDIAPTDLDLAPPRHELSISFSTVSPIHRTCFGKPLRASNFLSLFCVSIMTEATVGVLVDVSGSMESAYTLDGSSDRDASVERTHAILTTTMNIVKREVVHHDRRESVFACAFGLCKPPVTCDLISLLEYSAGPKEDGHRALNDLAKEHGASHAESWIKDHLSELEARFLYTGLRSEPSLIPKLIELIPSKVTTMGANVAQGALEFGPHFVSGFVAKKKDEAVKRSEAYKLAVEIIDTPPKPRPVQHVSRVLDDLLQSKVSSVPSSSLHDRIQELLEPIKPYIFGKTPMYRALNGAKEVFRKTNATRRVLFLLSDGLSTDGDPRPIARELHDLGVSIVTCFLTSDHIDNPRRLFYEADPSWKSEDGRRVLFEMSSTMQNTHTPISYLTDAHWSLPPSGESRLFIQANSLDVVNEFCEIVVSQMTEHCDALVHLLETVDLATYINQANAEFKPKQQYKGTCYANAIAAVFHLAMNRIVGREGGIPDFYTIRSRITHEYGVKGANTEKVLKKVCPEYRLHFREVCETGARQAINKRRPVVARFSLYEEQWEQFSAFYTKTPKGILRKRDVTGEF